MAMQDLNQLAVYTVSLEVLSGHGLPSKDIGGDSDPFVKVMVGGKEVKTKTIKNEANPVWNARFVFEFFDNPKIIRFDVLDEDLTGDDKIGFAQFNLEEYFNANNAKPFNGHLKLNNDKKKAKGTIKVKVSAQRILPLSLQKLSDQQKRTIYKQNAEIDSLNAQNEDISKENDSLKRERFAESEQAEPQQPGSSFPAIPTKKGKEAISGYIEYIMVQLVSFWRSFVLRKCIYEFPVFGYYMDLFVLFFGSLLRLEVGYNVFRGATSSKRPPNKLLKLYEFEGNAECKRVRETLCALDLDCIIYPCPAAQSGSPHLSRFGDDAKRLCGKSGTFPVLVDENYEDDGPLILLNSKQIIRYLYDEYGNNVKPTFLERVRYYISNHRVSVFLYQYFYLNVLRSLPEQGNERYRNTVRPKKLLELWSYEASPFCIKVRELLSSLEIPYVLKNVAVGSQQKRQEFQIRFGKKYPKWRQKLHLIKVPLLIDPNTQKEIFESQDINKYLIKTYCTA